MSDKTQLQSQIDNASSLEIELVWLPRIMKNQTTNERGLGVAIEHNGVGLSKFDVPFITDIFKQVRNGAHLSEGQARACRRVLRKYWMQYAKMQQSPTNSIQTTF